MKVPFIIFLLLMIAACAHAQQPGYSADLIPKELLSHATAVTRIDETTAEIKDKDNVIYHYKMVRTILNSNGDKYAGLQEWHNKSRVIKSIKGAIYNEFGVQVSKFSDSDFQDDSYSDGFSLFEDVKYKHFKPGATSYPYTVEYDYEIRSKQSMNIDSWYANPNHGVSVQHSSYVLICKPDLKLNFKEENYAEKVVPGVTASGMKTFTWQADNLPALRDEPYSPNADRYLTHVSITPQDFIYEGITGTYNNWNDLGKWIYDKLLTGRNSLSPETINYIKDLTKDAATSKEKAKKIYEFMQQKTRYISIQIGIGGFQPFMASDVDKLGYGDCKGLVNYTQALLKVADIDSYYCVVKSGSKKSSLLSDFASMDQADHIILCLPFKNDTTWLECTNKNIPFGYLGDFTDDRWVLACTPGGGKLMHTPKYSADENREFKKASFTLSENGALDGSMKTTFAGTQYENRDYLLNETYQDQLKAIKKDYPINNMEIESLKFDPQKKEHPIITESIKLKADEYASAENGKLIFLVNAANRVSGGPVEIRNRITPLYINRGYTDEDQVTYTLPNGYTPDRDLLNVDLHRKFGTYSAHVSVDGNRLTYTRKIQLIDGTYTKEDYNELVDFYQSVVDADHYSMTIVKNKNKSTHMNLAEEKDEIKKEFQLERVILFSDAVFAIIITIMVIDIKLPETIREATEKELHHAFKDLIFKFLGYSLSFFLVARFWMTHLKIFSFLKDYDKNVLMLNLAMLFTVSLFPFGVSLVTGVVNPQTPEYTVGISMYIGIVFTSILVQVFMVRYMLRHKQTLCIRTEHIENDLKWKALRANFYTIPAVLILFTLLILFGVPSSYAFISLAIYGVAMKRVFKKYYPHSKSNSTPLLSQAFRGRKQKLPAEQEPALSSESPVD